MLRLPASLAPRIVFIQYLAGLAIVEAVRTGLGEGYERLNVRIKWPNDVYAEVPEKEGDGADGAGGADAGTGAGGRKGTFILGGKRYAKMAGVLVNSQFAGKEFTLVVGQCSL